MQEEFVEKNRILIVDDEPFNLDLLEISLEDLENSEIIRAMDGFKVLKTVSEIQIDLIILDISMPELDGIEVLKQLKKDNNYRYIPVIVVTSKTEDRYRALEHGAEDFLSKPIDIVELRFRVNNLLKLKKFNDLQQSFNQRLEEEIEKKEHMLRNLAHVEQELELARDIQQSLVPKTYPNTPGLDVFGSCTPAFEVGGDYFDVFKTECGEHTIFIMSDVSGHGFASALVSMQFRTLARAALIDSTKSLSSIVEGINNVFSNENESGSMFITALFLRYCHKTQTMEFVNAGHHDPIGLKDMTYAAGIPLGIQAHMPFPVTSVPFYQDQSLLLYTDGIIEEENEEGEMYGDRIYTLHDNIKLLDAKSQTKLIIKTYNDFIKKQNDDVTVLIIKAI
ncbi:SpoIIE family protein phosphatase [bacterium]|nr:SpoIIE family protein phosphatase [bacterium]MBU1958511.1 SpoIIE family protein phosphatase [bacterium]